MSVAGILSLKSSSAAPALVSQHGPTCRRVAQSLGAAGVQVHTVAFPSSCRSPI